MRIDAVVPVNEALDVDHVACLECADCLIYLSIGSGQVTLNAEAVFRAVLVQGDVDVVSTLILEGNVDNGHAVEGSELVLIVDELIGAELVGQIDGGGNEIALEDFKGGVYDFDFAGPFSLVAGYTNLGANGERGVL